MSWTDYDALVQVARPCKPGKTCYKSDTLVCDGLSDTKATWTVSLELPLAAFKPGLCHPCMFENLHSRVCDPVEDWARMVKGAFATENSIPGIIKAPPRLIVESLPVQATPMVDDMFQGSPSAIDSNAFWLESLYLATALSQSTPSTTLNLTQYNWSGNKLKKTMIAIINQLVPGATQGETWELAVAVPVS